MRKYLPPLAALLLFGCTPVPAEIRAVMRNGVLVFEGYRAGIWPFARRIDVRRSLGVTHAGGIDWLIVRKDDPSCKTDVTLPIAYGKVPRCFVEKVKAAALHPGQLYRVRTDQYGAEGFFRAGNTPVNVPVDDLQQSIGNFPDNDQAYDAVGDTNLLSDNVILEVPSE